MGVLQNTNQPTNRAPNEPARPICAQESIFWGNNPNYFGKEQKFWYPIIRKPLKHLVLIVLLVGHGIEWIRKANIWPKMTKNPYFGHNLAVFGPKILIFTGGRKTFGTHITENLGFKCDITIEKSVSLMHNYFGYEVYYLAITS